MFPLQNQSFYIFHEWSTTDPTGNRFLELLAYSVLHFTDISTNMYIDLSFFGQYLELASLLHHLLNFYIPLNVIIVANIEYCNTSKAY